MSPFGVLWRTFFGQFFTSETVSSDIQLRNLMTAVIAFLLVPGILLVIELFFDYQGIVLRAIRYQQFERVTDALEWVEFVFVTYSMVTIGFIAVFEWDTLGFDRRDAMVLGPLPVAGTTIVAAKLAALAAFLVGAALAVNLPDAFVFAFATADRLGAIALVRHFVGHLTATVSAAAFVFAALVIARGLAGLAAGPRLAAALGTLLQFLFVAALLAVVILSPYVIRLPHRELVNPTVTGWLPSTWFMAVFEWLRGSPRAWIVDLSSRAIVGLPAALASAVVVSVAGYRREMRRALSPAATTGALGRARLLRGLAHILSGRSRRARGTSDFVLLTLVRERNPRAVIAITAAAGAAIVLAGLATRRGSFASLAAPRTAVLWIPLVLAYATAVGLRASFFVPSELPAAWTFHVNGPDGALNYRLGIRAAVIAVLTSVAFLTSVALLPVVGWRVAMWPPLVATAVALVLAEGVTLTVDFVPFTRAYEPGHAKLRTRWPLYLVGLFAFAYWPAKLEVRFLHDPAGLTAVVATLVAIAAVLHALGRQMSGWTGGLTEETVDEFYRITVLDIGAVN
ncbi:MAG: hypothetical protein ACM3SQ_16675 [Betaproteobacteria bacterium]